MYNSQAEIEGEFMCAVHDSGFDSDFCWVKPAGLFLYSRHVGRRRPFRRARQLSRGGTTRAAYSYSGPGPDLAHVHMIVRS